MGLPERLYRALLTLYPPAHRAAYGELMLTHFRDQWRDARQTGRGMGRLLLRTLLDAARTIPAEHLSLAKEHLMATHALQEPLPWWQIGLVVLPGLTLLPSLMTGDGTIYSFAAIILVVLVAGFLWQKERRFPAWALLLLGFLLVVGSVMVATAVSALIGSGTLLGPVLMGVLLAVLLVSALVVAAGHLRDRTLPPALRWLLPLLLVSALVSGLLAGADSNNPAGGPALLMLAAWRVAMSVILLAPVALGLPLARRYGLLTLLFVVGCLYPYYNGIMDPSYAVGLFTDSRLLIWTVELAAPALMLVVGPLWMLRAPSERGRIVGLLIPLAVAFIVGEAISQGVRYYTTWITFMASMLNTFSLWLTFLVAALLYRDAGDKSAAPSGQIVIAETPTM